MNTYHITCANLLLFYSFYMFLSNDIPTAQQGKPSQIASEKSMKNNVSDLPNDACQLFDMRDLTELLKSQGISVNLKNKSVEVNGIIIRDSISPEYPIEYVVVSEGGNAHEAFILIRPKPSFLNAALLCLGLAPGKTVKKIKAQGQSSTADKSQLKWELVPPSGTIMFIYVKYDGWSDKNTKRLEDLMLNLKTGKTVERTGWVYIGSRFATVLHGRQKVTKYMADIEKNIVACYLNGFGNSIFEINSMDGINDSLYDINPDFCPPVKSQVKLIFSLNPIDE